MARDVCVLYGREHSENSLNPDLRNNASCGFVLWGLVVVIVILILWIVAYVIMGLLGRPKM